MILTELLPMLRDLSRHDKLRLLQFLVAEMAKEEGLTSPENGAVYRVWSPYNSPEAAHKLTKLLEEHQKTDNV